MPILLDTHAWLWWATEDARLSRRAGAAIRRAAGADGVLLSPISIWEVAKKVEKRQLVLDRPLRQWLETATAMPGMSIAELTPAILVDSCELPQPFHGDPADQMIVASARHHGWTLVTKDSKLRDYPHVQTLW